MAVGSKMTGFKLLRSRNYRGTELDRMNLTCRADSSKRNSS
jgi:hypothetical protein